MTAAPGPISPVGVPRPPMQGPRSMMGGMPPHPHQVQHPHHPHMGMRMPGMMRLGAPGINEHPMRGPRPVMSERDGVVPPGGVSELQKLVNMQPQIMSQGMHSQLSNQAHPQQQPNSFTPSNSKPGELGPDSAGLSPLDHHPALLDSPGGPGSEKKSDLRQSKSPYHMF